MKPIFLALTAFIVICISSCGKEKVDSHTDILGAWVWKYSYSSGNAKMLSTDTTAVFSIQFDNNNNYINEAGCVIGQQGTGTYETQKLDNDRVLILKMNNNNIPDTFKLSVSNNQMILTETNNGYSWNHSFNKN